MAISLDVEIDEIFEFPSGRFRMVKELGGRALLFQHVKTGLERPIAEEQLVKMIDAGTVIRVELFYDRSGHPQAANNNDEIPPDATEMQLMRARTFQFYVEKWDDEATVGLGDVGLADLIYRHRRSARQAGFLWGVQPARLRWAIKNCGLPGTRPLRVFMSQRGKIKRSRLSDEVEQLLSKAVKFYWELRARDYNDAFAFFRAELKKLNEGRAKVGLSVFLPPKKMETLRVRINRAMSYVTWSQKYSKREADAKFKGVHDHLQAEKPGELVIMDHTVMDNWLLLDAETGIPLGRLTLTVAIDVATRCVLGYLISAEKPSIYSVVSVLKRVNRPKHYVKKLYPLIKGTWDAWCHPRELLVDNDMAFRSASLEAAMQDIGTKLRFAPVGTPTYKAIGERFFETLNSMLLQKIPGGIPYDVATMRKVDYDPTKDRVVDVDTLDALLHQLIIDTYHAKPHRGIEAIPAQVWDQKIQKHKRRFIGDPTRLDALLGRVAIASLSTEGIQFKGLRFHEPDTTTALMDDLLKTAPKRSQNSDTFAKGRVKVRIKWDPMDCSKIQVFNDAVTPSTYVVLPNKQQRFSSGRLSYWMAEEVRRYAIEQGLDYTSDDDLWEARNVLREAWEALLPKKRPAREKVKAERSAAQQDLSFLEEGEIAEVEAASSVEGWEEPDGIPWDTRAFEDVDPTQPPLRAAPGGKTGVENRARERAKEADSAENHRPRDKSETHKPTSADVLSASNAVDPAQQAIKAMFDPYRKANP